MSFANSPVVLVILDGWGIAPPGSGNAISQAQLPNINSFANNYIYTQLIAHGESVGLPHREPGNTETGHLNIGAGRIVYQDLPRINMSIADGSFFQNPAFISASAHVKKHNSKLHLLCLVGGGGVHSDLSHLFALLRFCHEQFINSVFIHIFTDGRDSPPTASMTYIKQLQSVIAREGIGKIASLMGRYYAMDRDFRWDRTAKAYFCLTTGQGKTARNVEDAITQAYAADQTDEFIEPTVILDSDNHPLSVVSDNDAVIFINFRIDRPRQLTKAFVLPDFEKTANIVGFDPYAIKYTKKHQIDPQQVTKQTPFSRPNQVKNLLFVTTTEYEKNLPVTIAFPPQVVENTLGKVISDHSYGQIRISESEKERFVTYYFNGLQENSFMGEERKIVPSPKIATYDLKPEMSAQGVTDEIIKAAKSNRYHLIVANFANPDMVGHTGNISATIKACQTVDSCLGQLFSSVVGNLNGILIITADHGNAEEMINLSTGNIDTEHNANPVPFIVVGSEFKLGKQVQQGILADIAPTVLSLLHLPVPINMSGRNLLSSLPPKN